MLGDETQEQIDNWYRWAGYYAEDEMDGYYCNARNVYQGRFLTRDPVQGSYQQPMTLHRYLYCLNDPLNRTDPTGEFFGLVGRVREQVDSIEMYYGALDAALGATGNPADMLDWLPGMNDFREYLFSPQKLNRESNWQIEMRYVIDEVGKVCDWSELGRCMGKEIVSTGLKDAAAALIGELSCWLCTSPYGDPASKGVFCVACGGYRVYQWVSPAATGLNLGACVLENCDWP